MTRYARTPFPGGPWGQGSGHALNVPVELRTLPEPFVRDQLYPYWESAYIEEVRARRKFTPAALGPLSPMPRHLQNAANGIGAALLAEGQRAAFARTPFMYGAPATPEQPLHKNPPIHLPRASDQMYPSPPPGINDPTIPFYPDFTTKAAFWAQIPTTPPAHGQIAPGLGWIMAQQGPAPKDGSGPAGLGSSHEDPPSIWGWPPGLAGAGSHAGLGSAQGVRFGWPDNMVGGEQFRPVPTYQGCPSGVCGVGGFGCGAQCTGGCPSRGVGAIDYVPSGSYAPLGGGLASYDMSVRPPQTLAGLRAAGLGSTWTDIFGGCSDLAVGTQAGASIAQGSSTKSTTRTATDVRNYAAAAQGVCDAMNRVSGGGSSSSSTRPPLAPPLPPPPASAPPSAATFATSNLVIGLVAAVAAGALVAVLVK